MATNEPTDTEKDKKKPTDPETGEGISPPIMVEGASNPNEVFGVPEEPEGGQPKLKLPEDYPAIPGKKLESNAYDFSAEKEPRRYGIGPDQVHYPDAAERPATVGTPSTAGYGDVATDKVVSAAELGVKGLKFSLPLATEIAAPLVAGAMVAGAATPVGLPVALLTLAGAGILGNTAAQKMRIGFGDQEEFSPEELGAAALFSLVPGFGNAASKGGLLTLRSAQGAVMATGESATRQGLEMGTGKREWGDFDKMELIFSAAIGSGVGNVLGRVEYKFRVHSPKFDEREGAEPGMWTMLRTLRDARKTVEADIKDRQKQLKQAQKAGNTAREDELTTEIEARVEVKEQIIEQWETFTRLGGRMENEVGILEQAIEELEVKKQAAQNDFIKAAQEIEGGQPTSPKKEHKVESVYDDMGEMDPGAEEALFKIAKDRDIGITRDREANTVVRNEKGEVIGGTFVSNDGDNYTFDVVVGEADSGTGVGSKLLDDVIEMPYELRDANPDATMRVDVVNSKMKEMLERRGFEVKEEISEGRWLMEPKDYDNIGKSAEPTAPGGSSKFEAYDEEAAFDAGEISDLAYTPFYKLVKDEKSGRDLYMNERGEILEPSDNVTIDTSLAKLDDEAFEKQFEAIKNEQRTLHEIDDLSKIQRGDIERRHALDQKVESFEVEEWRRKVEAEIGRKQDPDDPFDTIYKQVWDLTKRGDNVSKVKLAVAVDVIKKRGLTDDFKTVLENHKSWLGTQVEKADAEFLFNREMEKVAEVVKEVKEGKATPATEATAPNYERVKPDPAEAGQELPITQQRLAKVLNRWLDREEGASNDIDTPEGTSPQPEGVSGDPEVQKFIEFVNEEFPELFGPNRNKKPVTEKEFIADATKLANEFGVLGTDDANAFDALRRAINDPKNKDYVDQLRVFEMQGVMHALRASAGLKTVLNQLDEKDWSGDPGEMNDIIVDIYNNFAGPYMDLKAANTAYGRGLKSTQFTKPLIELELQEVTDKIEEQFVTDLKKASNLSPEALLEQIDNYGGMQRAKYLLQALAQSESYEEAAGVLKNLQKGFQDHRSVQHNLKLGTKPASAYHRIRDMGVDLWYNSMLSAPTTWIKAKVGNTIMGHYQPLQGMVGAGWNAVMATAPWYKGDISAKEWLRTARHWARVAKGYWNHSKAAAADAEKAFYGHGDLKYDTQYFERLGINAFEMERTGWYGQGGALLEEFGKWQGIPGRMMTSIDARTRRKVLHSMWDAHLHTKFETENGHAPDADEFAKIKKASLARYFTEDGSGIKTESDVIREGFDAAKANNVPADKMDKFVKDYVETNREKVDLEMLNYIERNIKEITFQTNPGEHGEGVSPILGGLAGVEKVIKGEADLSLWGGAKIRNQFGPETQLILGLPFMRTGRNIAAEAYSTSFAWMGMFKDVPKVGTAVTKMHTKLVDDLNNPNPLVAARAKGKIALSTLWVTTALALTRERDNQRDTLHYKGLEKGLDWKQQEALETAEGVKGNTLRFPAEWWGGEEDDQIAMDLAWAEPFVSTLQLFANTQHVYHQLNEEDQRGYDAAFQAFGIANVMLMRDKSWNAGIARHIKLMDAAMSEQPGDRFGRIARTMVNPAVPSAVNVLGGMTSDYRTDQSYSGWAGILQAIQRRLPGFVSGLPKYRDAFGRPIPRHGRYFPNESKTGSGAVNALKSIADPASISVSSNYIDKWTSLSESNKGVRVLNYDKFKAVVTSLNKVKKAPKKDEDGKEVELSTAEQAARDAAESQVQTDVRDATNALVVILGINPRFNDGTSIINSYTPRVQGKTLPPVKFKYVDLTKYKYSGEQNKGGPEQGQDAFDRWQELYSTHKFTWNSDKNGTKRYLNVGERVLYELTENPKILKHPKVPRKNLVEEGVEGATHADTSFDPRKEKVMKIMKRHREEALHQLFEEYPELKKLAQSVNRINRAQEKPHGLEELLNRENKTSDAAP